MDFFIHVCKHCEAECSGVYCNSCKSSEQRREMDKENKKINPNFICRVCELDWYSTRSKIFASGIIERIK